MSQAPENGHTNDTTNGSGSSLAAPQDNTAAGLGEGWNGLRHTRKVVESVARTQTYEVEDATARDLRKLVETVNAPIFGIDVHGNINEWNFKTAEITGYTRQESLGKPLVSTFILPRLRKTVKEVLDMGLKGFETSNYELEFQTKSGETKYLLCNATTRRNASNEIVGGEVYLFIF